MSKPLTAEQLDALRAVPIGTMRNKLRIALALTKARQSEVSEETGYPVPNLSKLVNGLYVDVTVDTAQKMADYFGCQIEDLFPRRDEEAVPARRAAAR
jgi:transcriptional regulator with XRE-family HTH domain